MVPSWPAWLLWRLHSLSVELAAAASSMALQPAVLDPAPNGRCARRLDRCVDRCLKSVAVQVDADIAPRDAPAGEQELRTLELGDGGTNDAYAILPLFTALWLGRVSEIGRAHV